MCKITEIWVIIKRRMPRTLIGFFRYAGRTNERCSIVYRQPIIYRKVNNPSHIGPFWTLLWNWNWNWLILFDFRLTRSTIMTPRILSQLIKHVISIDFQISIRIWALIRFVFSIDAYLFVPMLSNENLYVEKFQCNINFNNFYF